MPILHSCHPRSRKRLQATGFELDKRVIMHEPLGFHDYIVLVGIDEKNLLQAVATTVEMVENGDCGIPVPAYTEKNVSGVVVKIIQSYTGVVDKMVWRKY